MNVNTRKKGDISIIEVKGTLKMENVDPLIDTTQELLGSDTRLFVLDMSGVPWMDSTGIGQVIAIRNGVVEREGRIVVVLKDKMHDLFTRFELGRVLTIHSDLEEALACLAS